MDNFDPAVDSWINRAAFTSPAALSFGSSARSYTDLRNPNFYNENFGLLKKIRIHERFMVTFRAELFNAFNRVTLPTPTASNPSQTPTFDSTGRQTGGFGFINVINGLGGARTGQLVGRIQF